VWCRDGEIQGMGDINVVALWMDMDNKSWWKFNEWILKRCGFCFIESKAFKSTTAYVVKCMIQIYRLSVELLCICIEQASGYKVDSKLLYWKANMYFKKFYAYRKVPREPV
jgi:hypothetical protein